MPKKDEIKAKFVIMVKTAFQLDVEAEGKPVFVSWKRGSKAANKGETRKANASGKIAVFGDEIAIESTMEQDTKTQKWESKKLEFVIKMEDKKRAKVLGKAELELGDYCKNDGNFDSVVISGGDKKKKKGAPDAGPSLKLSIKCTWTHMNKKKIVEKSEGSSKVEIEGQEFGLQTETTDASDDEDATTVGDLSDDDSEMESEDDFKEPKKSSAKASATTAGAGAAGGASSAELSKVKEELAKEKEKGKERLSKLNAQKEEVKKLKKDLADAKKKASAASAAAGAAASVPVVVDRSDEVKELKDQLEATEKSKRALETEVAALKRAPQSKATSSDTSDKDREIDNLKAELQRAREDAEKARSSAPKGGALAAAGSAEVDRLRKEVQAEKERADKHAKDANALRDDLDRVRQELEEERDTSDKYKKELKEAKAATAGGAAVAAAGKGSAKGDDTVPRRDLDKVNKTLAKRMEELKLLERQVKEKDGEVEKLKDEVERLEKNLKGLYEASSKKAPSDNGSRQKDEIASLTKKYDEARLKSERLEKEVTKLRSQVEEAPKAGATGGGDEGLKRELRKLEREKEDMSIIEDHVYCMTAKYEDGSHISAMALTEILVEKHALEDPPNERLLARVLLAMKKAYQANSYDNNALVPWLSFGCMLHESLETEVGTSEDENSGDIPENGICIPKEGERPDVDDDDPVATFFHNLETLIFEIYSAVLRNLYTQLNEIVVSGILQLPSVITDPRSHGAVGKQDLKSFTGVLTDTFLLLKRHYVFDSVLQQFFCQVFYFLDAALFNHLVKRRDLCTCAEGFKIKLGLSQLEEWTNAPKADKRANPDPKKDRKILTYAAKNYLKHIHEAATVLVVGKEIFQDEKSIADAFPTLRPHQIKHLLESFQTDQFSPDSVPKKAFMTLDNMTRHSDDDSSGLEVDEGCLLRLPTKVH
eukprot:TRINITY_DN393_c0_g2_i1.p1 TRINITY_DN393_c0_g2~~TRINITY_DN393_c0_g2_i1.p1  ORF type:complete len:938 (+),score=285.04 TRINITY_DN393_c0_g2_i1:237-3050(+)